jgi:hypothetical protein
MRPMIGSLPGEVQPCPPSDLFVARTLELNQYKYLVYDLRQVFFQASIL